MIGSVRNLPPLTHQPQIVTHPTIRPTSYLNIPNYNSQTAIVESSSYRIPLAMPPEVHHLFHHPIADHSFSADRGTLAVARENNIELYARSGNGFSLKDELRGHDKTVTGVDIAPRTGKIVTCSQGVSLQPNLPEEPQF